MKIRPLPNWTGRTVVCIASGPSLTDDDVAVARAARVPTIVTNTTFRKAIWADALFGFDYAWWKVYRPEVFASTFTGRMFCQSLRWGHPKHGIEWPGVYRGYKSFGNSGACAVALAVAAGARRVVLLGFDGQAIGGRMHHHDDHPAPLRNCDTMSKFLPQFERLAKWAESKALIVNASPGTAIPDFARMDLQTALAAQQREAA